MRSTTSTIVIGWLVIALLGVLAPACGLSLQECIDDCEMSNRCTDNNHNCDSYCAAWLESESCSDAFIDYTSCTAGADDCDDWNSADCGQEGLAYIACMQELCTPAGATAPECTAGQGGSGGSSSGCKMNCSTTSDSLNASLSCGSGSGSCSNIKDSFGRTTSMTCTYSNDKSFTCNVSYNSVGQPSGSCSGSSGASCSF